MDAEAVLLVHHRKAEVVERHAFLEQRMRAHHDADRTGLEASQRRRPLAALFAAGEDRGCDAGLFRQRRDRGKMLARQDLGRRHQGGLPPGFCLTCHSKQRHHRLAGADIALQQAQHAFRLAQVGFDFGKRLFLRAGERIGQGFAYPLRRLPVALGGAAAAPASLLAQKGERKLPGKQFVIGEPPPRGAFDHRIERIGRVVQPFQGLCEGRKGLAAQQFAGDPLGQGGKALQRAVHRAAQELRRQAGGERIDRLDERQLVRVFGARDVVRVDHGRAAVEPLHPAADDNHLADRQKLFDPIAVRAEEGQPDLAGVVVREHAVGLVVQAARRWLVPVHAQVERDDRAFRRQRDARPLAAVDHGMRQHEEKIRCPCVPVAEVGGNDLLDQRAKLRPHPGKRGDRHEDRIEKGRAHAWPQVRCLMRAAQSRLV